MDHFEGRRQAVRKDHALEHHPVFYGVSNYYNMSRSVSRMRIDIWTIREEHIVFKDVLYSTLSEKEKFLIIKRSDTVSSTEYIPTIEIKRFKATNI